MFGGVLFTSCKTDEDLTVADEVVDIATQNTYDDQAAQKYLTTNYFDSQGKIVAYSDTDTSDDNYPSLSTYNVTTLPSGVVVVMIPTAQPSPGKTINSEDVLRLTSISKSVVAKKVNDIPTFTTYQDFINTINTGVPEVDPFYFYAKNSILNGNARSYFEIEGFQEGIKLFKSYEIPDVNNYNMQGVIIVPSRAAFARDSNALDALISGQVLSFVDRSFIFNVQVYKTTTRTTAQY